MNYMSKASFSPKDAFYDNHISTLKESYKNNKNIVPIYPSRESFDEGIRKALKEKNPNEVIEGVEKIGGETVPVWYFYHN